ncbi:MAG: T9SS type A sorting domain-containing protein [Flavobacteriaceae bacterium]|jgi:hypothetical protein|nr:T9SS type A sorting domain-containing protein [Flavobacteriaceae bacterium]
MKKIFTILAVAMATMSFAQYGPTTYTWDCSTLEPTSGSNDFIPSVAFDAVQGNNNGTTPLISTTSPSSGYPEASGGENFGAACFKEPLSTDTSTYFSVTIAPDPVLMDGDTTIDLLSISLGSRSTATGPDKITIYSSIDNYTAPIGSISGLNANGTNWAFHSISFPEEGGAISGSVLFPVTLRIYGSDSTSSGTPPVNTANWRIDDIELTILLWSPLAVSDVTKVKNPLIKNTLVSDNLVFAAKSDVSIYDMAGKVVKTLSVEKDTIVNVSFLPKGTYIVTGTVNGEKSVQKFIKQ